MSQNQKVHPQIDVDLETTSRMGFWVPNKIWAVKSHVAPMRRKLKEKKLSGASGALAPSVQALKSWAGNTSFPAQRTVNLKGTNMTYLYVINAMITEANVEIAALCAQNSDLASELQTDDADQLEEIGSSGTYEWVSGSDELFDLLSMYIQQSPEFLYYNDKGQDVPVVQVGTPLNGLFAIGMGTQTGYVLFKDPQFNAQLYTVLQAWHDYLGSSDSLGLLDIQNPEQPGSWISNAAWEAGVWDQMAYNKEKPAYGYSSWTDFFTRQFADIETARPFPTQDPDGKSPVVNIGCETTPWIYANNVALTDPQWIKGNTYSLTDIFGGMTDQNDQPWANKFEGGQIYQGFLSATHYHRWHAPLTGNLCQAQAFNGEYYTERDSAFGVTYFAQPDFGENSSSWEGTQSQQYLAQTAARAVYIFQHEVFGYVAMVCVGMVEVSSVNISNNLLSATQKNPISVTAGEEIGTFEFGGSTHLLIFQKDKVALEEWATNIDQNSSTVKHLGTVIATPKS